MSEKSSDSGCGCVAYLALWIFCSYWLHLEFWPAIFIIIVLAALS